MLKLLEEPPPDTWFVLTSSEPGRLLPTVRSRATAAYLPPLPKPRVREFLLREATAPIDDVERATSLSDGSIGRALGFLPDRGEPGPLESVRRDAFHLLKAAVDPGSAGRCVHALSVSPAGARGLQPTLSALEGWIRDLAVLAAESDVPLLNQDGRDWLSKTVLKRRVDPARVAHSLAFVQAARSRAAGNVNPQLFLARLLSDLHEALAGGPSSREAPHIPEHP
jgi:DNA polymerase III subunit delta'